MKLNRLSLIQTITEFIAQKQKELSSTKDQEAQFKKDMAHYRDALRKFSIATIPDDAEIMIRKQWNAEQYEISISYMLKTKSIPLALRSEPEAPANSEEKLNALIKQAKEEIALLKHSKDEFIHINSKLDKATIATYLLQS